MEAISLPSPPVVGLASNSLARKAAAPSRRWLSSSRSPALFHDIGKRCRRTRTTTFPGLRPRAAGTMQDGNWPNQTKAETSKQETLKQNDIAFVAGATGRVGSRTVRELLKLGFKVRAGVRNAQRAEWLVQSAQNMKLDETDAVASGSQPVERLELVECDLENQQEIAPAIGTASIVVCCIGASEKEIFDVTGPYRIDYQATKNLIDAAAVAKVDHFILVTSLGTNKVGFPAALLNLFWGVLSWKRKAEEALIASGVPYTIVRPGGMERPTDAFKETHNLVLADEDTYFGGLVSNLQVAELIAFMAKNRRLSYCKVVEAIAETTAPLTSMDELLSKIPSQRVDTSLTKGKTDFDPKIESTPPKLISDAVDEEELAEPLKTRPLSPYIMYDDLKPPTSPTPRPSASSSSSFIQPKSVEGAHQEDVTEKESTKSESKKMQPLSPYMSYDDLKPPTSPTPRPSASNSSNFIQTKSAEGAHEDVTEKEPTKSESKKTQSLSPYMSYEDLKPPTSPSPTAPVTSSFTSDPRQDSSPHSSLGASSINASLLTEEIGEYLHADQKKVAPLSPFTMYEELMPPASPSPSMPKH